MTDIGEAILACIMLLFGGWLFLEMATTVDTQSPIDFGFFGAFMILMGIVGIVAVVVGIIAAIDPR